MKISPNKPVLVGLYGFPGSGKSYIARNLSSSMAVANVSADRIRSELFATPRFDDRENAIVTHLANYMTEEFLQAGVSVIYDAEIGRAKQRRWLRDMARKHGADFLLVWIQVDPESAFVRTQRRDRRTIDDKFAEPLNRERYDRKLANMQNPEGEDYIVVSGKHAFVSQKNAIINRLYHEGLISVGTVQENVVAKPGLVNLIPSRYADRVDYSRRNISIN